ncbi:FecR family protein [Dinghuibacter silviterrae]|uniref:FecR family protein n=1 Tax=Dinghuibacter silviterrae TaxID=1539049 RepID=A0A4R8DEQ8_9BACT|nr:FecR family protein [Dinghuibacter silviterrae]TDW96031.1 FecR family protein [Dinghuibacter silviterrae]
MEHLDCWKLLENEAFVHWVLKPDATSDRYWEGWMRQDPSRVTLVEQAKEALLQLQQSPAPREGLSQKIWEGIQRELQADVIHIPRRSNRWWAVAATVVLLTGAGAALWYSGSRPVRSQTPVAPIAVHPVQGNGNDLIECSNQSQAPQRIYLVDGSVVTLEPHSTLSYIRFLNKDTREVTLKGNAFFEIAPDPQHPFLVRSGDVVTRVLGTSFRVMSDPGTDDIHVAVRTGKVSVYKAAEFDKGQRAFCILLPHQEAVFHKREQNLAFVSNAEAQLLTPPAVETVSLDFDDEPVVNILSRLENMYHIRIQYNKDSLQQCRLTTSLAEERLADKLDIICRAINASYRTEGDAIVIQGGRCP